MISALILSTTASILVSHARACSISHPLVKIGQVRIDLSFSSKGQNYSTLRIRNPDE